MFVHAAWLFLEVETYELMLPNSLWILEFSKIGQK